MKILLACILIISMELYVWVEKKKLKIKLQEEIKEQTKRTAEEVANFVTEIVFAEKETVLQALEEDDEGMLQDEIYYYIQECE